MITPNLIFVRLAQNLSFLNFYSNFKPAFAKYQHQSLFDMVLNFYLYVGTIGIETQIKSKQDISF